MWLLEQSCGELIRHTWINHRQADGMRSIMDNIAACRLKLETWNQHTFGHVQKKLRKCQRRFEEIRVGPITNEAREEEKDLLHEFEDLIEREEVL